jgi:uncharacterized protein
MSAPRHAATALLAAWLAAGLAASGAAQAPTPQGQTPPAAQTPPPAPAKPASKPAVKPAPQKPVAAKPAPADAAATTAAPATPGHEPDLAFGAFQRGYYLSALSLATKRVEEKQDIKAMTLLGEIYANGFGVSRDDVKAASWYKQAADRGDREAMFALAMFRLSARGGPLSREEATRLLAAAAKLGHVAAAYDLGLLYLEGQLFPQDFARAAELFRGAAQAGNPEAQ